MEGKTQVLSGAIHPGNVSLTQPKSRSQIGFVNKRSGYEINSALMRLFIVFMWLK